MPYTKTWNATCVGGPEDGKSWPIQEKMKRLIFESAPGLKVQYRLVFRDELNAIFLLDSLEWRQAMFVASPKDAPDAKRHRMAAAKAKYEREMHKLPEPWEYDWRFHSLTEFGEEYRLVPIYRESVPA